MTRWQNICWQAQDAVLAWWERRRIRRAARRLTADPEETAYDAAWARQDAAQECMERIDRAGRIVCYIVTAIAAAVMVIGTLKGSI